MFMFTVCLASNYIWLATTFEEHIVAALDKVN